MGGFSSATGVVTFFMMLLAVMYSTSGDGKLPLITPTVLL